MRVWMTMDPENNRVTLQDRPFTRADFPPGLRGDGWPQREGEITDERWADLMAGTPTYDEVDAIHRECWTESGDTPWPNP